MADQKVDIESIGSSAYGARVSRLAAIKDLAIAITIVNPALSQTDTLTINGHDVVNISSGAPTVEEIAAAFVAAINADPVVNGLVQAAPTADADGFTVKAITDLAFTEGVSANLADTFTAAPQPFPPGPNVVPCVLVAIVLDADATGVVTLYENGVAKQIIPAAALKAGVPLVFPGLAFDALSIKQAQIADVGAVYWKAAA